MSLQLEPVAPGGATDVRTAVIAKGGNRRVRLLMHILALCASLAISGFFLANRNIYDDELYSLSVMKRPLPNLWEVANSSDVHPPGMYALSHFGYGVTGSDRWATAGALLIFYAGLATLVSILGTYFAEDLSAYALFLVLAYLHPQTLLWANSLRWYPYWTGLALLVISLLFVCAGVRPDWLPVTKRFHLSWAMPVAIGAILGAMFYLNYLTAFFAAALLVAALLVSVHRRRMLWTMASAFAIAAVLVLPQLRAFATVHLRNTGSQDAPPIVAAGRLIHGLVISEAMLPWNPAGLLFGASLGILLLVSGVRKGRDFLRGERAWQGCDRAGIALLGFIATLAFSGVATGLAAKPRSFIVLCPVLAFLASLALVPLRPRFLGKLVLLLSVCWTVAGTSNLLRREGIAKASLNDRPEEVIDLIANVSGSQCAAVFTHDFGLTYELSKTPVPLCVASSYGDMIESVVGPRPCGCRPRFVFVVKSFEGSLLSKRPILDRALSDATQTITAARTANLSPDRSAGMKRRLPFVGELAKSLPDYRFVVTYGPARPDVDWPRVNSEIPSVPRP